MSFKSAGNSRLLRPRVIAVSGLAYTGSTTFAEALAGTLGWNVNYVGQRFRDYCERQRIDLGAIPPAVHQSFDQETLELLRSGENLVIEGRYLAILSTGLTSVFRVQTMAHTFVRAIRCVKRESRHQSFRNPFALIEERDRADYETALRLYRVADFTDPAFFDLNIRTHTLRSRKAAFKKIENLIHSAPQDP